MEHVAILKSSWNLKEKILSGQKTIESRWYLHKSSPWNRIKTGETIYFKNSGELITLKAEASSVLEFSKLTPLKVKEILNTYGEKIGVGSSFFELVKNKKYCILIFLKNVHAIKPFSISKKGFGNMAAWICVEDINSIKIS